MTLNRETIERLQEATPAMALVYAEYLDRLSANPTDKHAETVVNAMWAFPELVECAKLMAEYVALKAKGSYHTLQVTEDAVRLTQP